MDLDTTDDPLYGYQASRFFHGYYINDFYLPLYIFCGSHLRYAKLRPSDIDASAGSVKQLNRIVKRIRRQWPEIQMIIRGDSGFCRESIMAWCEDHRVDYSERSVNYTCFAFRSARRIWSIVQRWEGLPRSQMSGSK